MSQTSNCNYFWRIKFDFLVCSTIPYVSWSFVFWGRVNFCHSPWTKTLEQRWFFAWNIGPNNKTFLEMFDTLNFKVWSICGLIKSQFVSGGLRWFLSAKSFLVFFKAFAFIYLFIHLFFAWFYILLKIFTEKSPP